MDEDIRRWMEKDARTYPARAHDSSTRTEDGKARQSCSREFPLALLKREKAERGSLARECARSRRSLASRASARTHTRAEALQGTVRSVAHRYTVPQRQPFISPPLAETHARTRARARTAEDEEDASSGVESSRELTGSNEGLDDAAVHRPRLKIPRLPEGGRSREQSGRSLRAFAVLFARVVVASLGLPAAAGRHSTATTAPALPRYHYHPRRSRRSSQRESRESRARSFLRPLTLSFLRYTPERNTRDAR